MPPVILEPDAVLSMLIHAPSKEGKSTLTATAPLPLLVLDVEGSWRFINQAGFKTGVPLRKKRWNPLTEEPPRYDGTWDVCIVMVRDYVTMQQVLQRLTQQPHDFVSIIIDSVTEVQRRCRANLKGSEAMQIQDWGVLLNQMDALIRAYRDLTLADSTVRCVILVAETKMKDGKWRPYMQGQIADSMPYWLDVVGYLYTYFDADADGQPTVKKKVLHIGPSDQWYSGERVQGALPDAILDPNITQMIMAIFPPNTPNTPNSQVAVK
jgi:hypothetical protein